MSVWSRSGQPRRCSSSLDAHVTESAADKIANVLPDLADVQSHHIACGQPERMPSELTACELACRRHSGLLTQDEKELQVRRMQVPYQLCRLIFGAMEHAATHDSNRSKLDEYGNWTVTRYTVSPWARLAIHG